LPIRLTNGPLSYELPFPSADGKHIYVIGRKQRGELVRYDRNSQQFVPFLSGISASDATVSNDGRWVAYQSYPDHALWRSRIDGSDRLQLTYSPTYVFYPRISPDGTKVAYGAEDENGITNAYVVSMDGGVPTKIVDNAINGVNWQFCSGKRYCNRPRRNMEYPNYRSSDGKDRPHS
jgi:Tol biopolymer transport system component